jgi:hypothetical protein
MAALFAVRRAFRSAIVHQEGCTMAAGIGEMVNRWESGVYGIANGLRGPARIGKRVKF